MSPFAERRRRLLERFQGVMVLPSAPVAIRNNDVEHEYRQDSDLHYTTGLDEPESVLVLSTVHPEHRVVLFVRPRDPERAIWDGERAGLEGAIARHGADAAYSIDQLGAKLPEYLTGASRLHYRLGRDRAMDDRLLEALDRARGRGRSPQPWPTEIVDPAVVLHEMRLLKDDGEIERMARAAAITRDAHLGAMRLAAPGRHEYEIEALLRQVFRQSGAERPAYGPIVGSGPNATVLHYRANARRLEDGDLLLVDAGCEYDYYASDVTRTFPVSGSFSGPQRVVYEIVLAAQLAAIAAVRPGSSVDHVHEVTVGAIVDGLLSAKLLRGDRAELIASQGYRPFFMHRTSHWLGMDVHDVGGYYVAGRPRAFEPGMVLTVEPGIYIPATSDRVPPEYRGIGVRIEDDILVTAEGHRDLTADIPKAVDDVERACRG